MSKDEIYKLLEVFRRASNKDRAAQMILAIMSAFELIPPESMHYYF